MTAPVFDPAFQAQLRLLLWWRRDVREFRRDPIPPDTITRLIGLAGAAPSVGLSQPWRFVLVDDPDRRAAIAANFAAANADALAAQAGERASLYARLKLAGLSEAPVQFAVFADRGTPRGHRLGRLTMPEMAEYSAVLAAYTLWLVARAEGLGLGWVSILDPVGVAQALDIPGDWRFIGYFCLGYPREEDDVPALERAGWETRQPATNFIIRR